MPGSGKTHLGKELSKVDESIYFFDDASARGKDLVEFLDRVSQEIGTVIVADVNLCEPLERDSAVEFIRMFNPDTQFEWIYFENDPEKCRRNVSLRCDGRNVEGSIRRFSATYRIPEDVTPRPIWQIEDEIPLS